jgi:hypothetical protein
MIITLPIRIRSEANLHEHWRKHHARHKLQKMLIESAFRNAKPNLNLPIIVTMTRIAPRAIDDDNLAYSLKHCRDVIANIIIPGLAMGRADADPRIKWEYGQEKGIPKEYGLKIEVRNGIADGANIRII